MRIVESQLAPLDTWMFGIDITSDRVLFDGVESPDGRVLIVPEGDRQKALACLGICEEYGVEIEIALTILQDRYKRANQRAEIPDELAGPGGRQR